MGVDFGQFLVFNGRASRQKGVCMDSGNDKIKVVDVEEGIQESKTDASPADPGTASNVETPKQTAQAEEPKVEIQFAGSEMIRTKFPKTFDAAEKVATDWIHNGKFEGIDLGHPMLSFFATKGLQKAKEVEKKVLESPLTEKVATDLLTAGLKAQGKIAEIKEKLTKK